jgi:hypothetical protein
MLKPFFFLPSVFLGVHFFYFYFIFFFCGAVVVLRNLPHLHLRPCREVGVRF